MLTLISMSEIENVMNIISDAKQLLKATSGQWQQGYPNIDTIKNDILNKNLYGIYDNNILVAIIVLMIGFEENYIPIDNLFQNKLSNNDLIIHRVAIRKEYYNQGLGKKLILEAIDFASENNISSIKVDTHTLNIPMNKALIKCGFSHIGDVFLNNGEENNKREVYEKVL